MALGLCTYACLSADDVAFMWVALRSWRSALMRSEGLVGLLGDMILLIYVVVLG